MSQYSNSPLGLVMTSKSTDSSSVGKYVISGTGSNLSSIFFNNDNSQTYNFNSNTGTSTIYNNDISTEGIVKYTSDKSAMRLKYSDFAYLKNIGVYPNNRLVVARRFASPVGDDLTALKKNLAPMATLVSWVPDNTEFITTSFGEEWVTGDASFKSILNELGDDITMNGSDNKGAGLGGVVSRAANAVPLPGFTEGLQYAIFKKLGMSDLDASGLPYGNPNLIRESKRRSTPGKEESWSGIKCKFNIKMVVEYEQKFINGIDPTIVYYDIIANALTFGTSESKFQFRGGGVGTFEKFLGDMGSGDPGRIKSALSQFVSAIADSLKAVGDAILKVLSSVTNSIKQGTGASDAQKSLIGAFNTIASTILEGLVNKYKLRIISVVNSLTGTPSAPWHVTVGNPRRPIFSSGDMVMDKVTLTMGKTLGFNDLPSSIKLEFELESARNIGAQEIYTKFNCGKERTYTKSRLSFVETDASFNKNQIAASTKTSALNTPDLNSTSNNTISSSNSSSGTTAQQSAPSIYPASITNLPNSSVTTNSNGTSFISAPVPQMNNQQVLFMNSGVATDANGNYIGNWTANGKDTILNLNSNNTGKKTVTIPG